MIPSDLPDDIRQWPDDPFELLGVVRGSDEAAIKRAYTRLIRRFKPEHSPDQFRRVREAYEACLQLTTWMRLWESGGAGPFEVVGAPVDSAEKRGAVTGGPAAEQDEVERLWSRALAGEESEAYVGLASLSGHWPDRADIPLRLYWLLTLNPERDPDRSRHDWLAEALVRSRLRGPAAELYRRELDVDPTRVGYDVYRPLLNCEAQWEDLLVVARYRVTAAGRAGLPLVMATDLVQFEGRLAGGNELAWLGLVAAAADWAAWMEDPDLSGTCAKALSPLRHLELAHPEAFDRLEESKRVANDGLAARARGVPEEVIELARLEWCGYWEVPVEEAVRAARAVLGWYSGRPGGFDMYLQVRGPAIPFLFARALDRVRSFVDPEEPSFPPDLLRGLARRLPMDQRSMYGQARHELYRILVEEAVDPLEFSAALASDPDYRFRGEIGPAAGADLSMRVLWLSSQIAG